MKASRWFYPHLKWEWLPAMLGYTILGALVAGVYGAVHDQVTYTLGEEYFTCFKFDQFAYADFGFHPRIWVATIGWLATWWVGAFVGWLLARVVVPNVSKAERWPLIQKGFLLVMGGALMTAATGWLLAWLGWYDHEGWQLMGTAMGVKDVPAFVRVAYVHNGSYLGGLIGLMLALIAVKREMKTKLK